MLTKDPLILILGDFTVPLRTGRLRAGGKELITEPYLSRRGRVHSQRMYIGRKSDRIKVRVAAGSPVASVCVSWVAKEKLTNKFYICIKTNTKHTLGGV